MGAFSSWPARANGDTVEASWWNVIRTWAMGYVGAGSVSESQVTITNSQSVASDLTGLSVSSAIYRTMIVEYHVARPSVSAYGELVAVYKPANSVWMIVKDTYHGDDHGLTFSITDAGQFQYTSDAKGAGTIRFRARSFNAPQ